MLTPMDVATYEKDGVLVLPELFTPAEVAELRVAFDRDAKISGDHRIIEPNGTEVRAVYGSHQRQPEYLALARSQRLLGPAQQLLGPKLYVYQFKINAKAPFAGNSWAWHQDYIAFKIADGLPAARLINVALFLDEVNEFNGPIIFVAGSHTDGVVRNDRSDSRRSDQHVDPDDIALSPAELSALVGRHRMVSPKGPVGTVVFFHPEIVHGSAANMSPFPRRVVLATYNEIHNTPRPAGKPRPDYLVGRDTRPLEIEEDLIVPAKA